MKGLCVSNLTGHTNLVYALNLLPNGLLASGSKDKAIMIWDIAKTYPLYTLTGHSDSIRALTLINDAYLASSSSDLTIKIWSLSSYSIVKSWTASTNWLLALAYDSTLNVLSSGGTDNKVKVWESSLLTSVSISGKLVYS